MSLPWTQAGPPPYPPPLAGEGREGESAHWPQRKYLKPKGDNTVTATDAATTSIDVLSSLALRGVLLEIANNFRALTGLSFAATYKSTNMSLSLIAEGATADMTSITTEPIDRLRDCRSYVRG